MMVHPDLLLSIRMCAIILVDESSNVHELCWFPTVEHVYLASSPAAESERTMLFYDDARVDGLTKREETPASMEEHFVNRDDFLYYMHIEFGPKPKKVGPKGEDANPRPILVRFNL